MVVHRYYRRQIVSALVRGLGRLYLRGDIWWFDIGIAGRKVRLSTGLRGGVRGHPPREVELWRAHKLTQLGRGGTNSLLRDPLTVDAILDALEARYRAEARPSLVNALNRIKKVRAYFTGWRVQNLTPSSILMYAVQRRDRDKAAIATINLEAALLRRALYIAWEDGLIPSVPKVPRLPGAHVRQGFLEESQFVNLVSYLDPKYRGVCWFLWHTGWRLGEALKLRWERVSWESMEILLDTSKNGEARSLPFGSYPQLETVLRGQYAVARFGAVFPVKRKSLQHAWEVARERAGLRSMIHDLRRSFVRRCEREGVPRSVAMAITGHKSEAVYRRYAIISRRDVEDGLAKLSRAVEAPVIARLR